MNKAGWGTMFEFVTNEISPDRALKIHQIRATIDTDYVAPRTPARVAFRVRDIRFDQIIFMTSTIYNLGWFGVMRRNSFTKNVKDRFTGVISDYKQVIQMNRLTPIALMNFVMLYEWVPNPYKEILQGLEEGDRLRDVHQLQLSMTDGSPEIPFHQVGDYRKVG
jgi:hypothetical protein